MNIDPNLDYDALLTAAKVKRALMNKGVAEHCNDNDSGRARLKCIDEYEAWVKRNLTDRGIRMTVSAVTGEPKSLYVVVAGEDF